MDPTIAQQIARKYHAGQRTRFGETVAEHLAHVSNAVAADAKAVAWLHELFELTPVGRDTLRAHGLTANEEATLDLLTHIPTRSYKEYIGRIAHAPGRPGELARMVKLADLNDHLGHNWIPPGAPPYSWARRYIAEQQDVARSWPTTG